MESQIATCLMGQKRLQIIPAMASIKKEAPSWPHPCEVTEQNGKSLRGSLFDIPYVRRQAPILSRKEQIGMRL